MPSSYERLVASSLGRAAGANMVIQAMSDRAYELLEPILRCERYRKGATLWKSSASGRLYFPLSGLITVAAPVPDGTAILTGFVGRESAAGLSSGCEEHTTGIVLIEGMFASLPVAAYQEQARHSPELRHVARRCHEWLAIQAHRNAACHAAHDAEQRFSRWLLQVVERTGREIVSTQEEIAALLGIRRTTLTLIAHRMQSEGLLRHRRGRIFVSDTDRLASLACCCHRTGPKGSWAAEHIIADHAAA
jgi:CRP-like cAMP-binding protein